MPLPPLPSDWEPTRARLHAFAAAAGAVARAHLPAHPKWWHVSLEVADGGLATDEIGLPDGRAAVVVLDPGTHHLRVEVDGGVFAEYSLREAPSDVAPALFDAMADLGLDDTYERERLHTDPDGAYDDAHAAAFWGALRIVADALEDRRTARPGETSPVQLWPHGFDIAFEWFGNRIVEHDEGDATESLPAQLNLGWYPAGDAYFYSNPWPFDRGLLDTPLPGPAMWQVEPFEGSVLAHADVVEHAEGMRLFAEYADAVFEAARPTLTV